MRTTFGRRDHEHGTTSTARRPKSPRAQHGRSTVSTARHANRTRVRRVTRQIDCEEQSYGDVMPRLVTLLTVPRVVGWSLTIRCVVPLPPSVRLRLRLPLHLHLLCCQFISIDVRGATQCNDDHRIDRRAHHTDRSTAQPVIASRTRQYPSHPPRPLR
jgi:hypothetical protein